MLQDVLAAKVIVNISSDHMEELNSVNMCGVEEYFKNARLLNPACGAHGERATVSTAAEVTKNLKQSVFGKGCTTFVNTLKTMRGVAIAGGSIAAAVLPHTRALTDTTAFGTDSPPRTPPGNATASDIDIVFFNNMSRSEVVANVARLCTLIPGNTVAGVMCSSFKLDVVRPPPFCNISFLLNVGSTLESILCGFDLDACQVAFDGRQVLGTPRALAALSTRTCVLHRTCDPRSFDRVMKYVERGYTMAVPRCLSNGMDHNATLWLELIGKLEAQEHRMRLTGLHEPNVRGTDNGPHEDPDVVYIAEYIGLCRTMGRAGGMPEYYKYPVPALRMATELSPYGETFLRWRDTGACGPTCASAHATCAETRPLLPRCSHRDDARPVKGCALAGLRAHPRPGPAGGHQPGAGGAGGARLHIASLRHQAGAAQGAWPQRRERHRQLQPGAGPDHLAPGRQLRRRPVLHRGVPDSHRLRRVSRQCVALPQPMSRGVASGLRASFNSSS